MIAIGKKLGCGTGRVQEVWANAIPAAKSLSFGGPIGLAHNFKLKRPVAKDTAVTFDDVELVNDLDVVDLRRHMEAGARKTLMAA
jgi:predicted homoserine dehydrogenase-like protein